MSWNNWYPKLPPEIAQEEFISWVRKNRNEEAAKTWIELFRVGMLNPPVIVTNSLCNYIEAIRKEKGISGG